MKGGTVEVVYGVGDWTLTGILSLVCQIGNRFLAFSLTLKFRNGRGKATILII